MHAGRDTEKYVDSFAQGIHSPLSQNGYGKNPNDDASSKVKWHLKAVARAEVDKEKVLENYRGRARAVLSVDGVEWSG